MNNVAVVPLFWQVNAWRGGRARPQPRIMNVTQAMSVTLRSSGDDIADAMDGWLAGGGGYRGGTSCSMMAGPGIVASSAS